MNPHHSFKPALITTTAVFLLEGCMLFHIHPYVHNPSRTPRYPEITEARRLLGMPTHYRTCFDVHYYDLRVRVMPDDRKIAGESNIYAKAVTDFDTLQIDLYNNMKINGITADGQPAGYFRKEHAVYVLLRMHAGDTFHLEVRYEGAPLVAKKPPWRGGFVWKKDKAGNPWIGVACETEGASLWWPNKDDTADEPDSASVSITAPAGLTGVSNGLLRDSAANPDGTVTWRWFTSYPVNNYNITLYIGDFRLIRDHYIGINGDTLHMTHYVLPEHYAVAGKHFQQLKRHLAAYEKYFGDYPWYRDGFKLVESPYAGMEHQTAIAYGNRYRNDRGWFDYIILHETAHEWWGNAVTAADLSDVWLQEGFATYSEALFVESVLGSNAYQKYLLTYRIFIRNSRPVVGPAGCKFFDYKDSDVYMKGAWILHTLRNNIQDDSLFLSILKTFNERHRYTTVSSQDFIALVHEMTGKDYGWFFRQYLYDNRVPFLQYQLEGNVFYYRWDCVQDDFRMPVTVRFGEEKRNLIPSRAVQKEVVPPGASSFSINNNRVLFGAEKNNTLEKLYRKTR